MAPRCFIAGRASAGAVTFLSRRPLIVGFALFAGCAPPPAPGGGGANIAHVAVAQAWISLPDRSRLLARVPDLPMGEQPAEGDAVIVVDVGTRYQEMVGFGAALTDASASLIASLEPARRDSLLRELFGPEPGVGFSFLRVPMGASDFSVSHYSYDDRPAGETDPELAHFSIHADRATRLPLLRAALAINPRLRIVASPWSAPGWMKTSGRLVGGTLRPEAYDSFARYLVRFVRAYESAGVPVFAITLQNEPDFEPGDYPGMRLSAAARAELIGRHVGPLIAREGLATRILEWDHNWDQPAQPLAVLGDSASRRYLGGIAWHCYAGDVGAQDSVHRVHPDVDVYFTECSGGAWAPNFADNLRWNVSTLVIGIVRGWARGVALWNLALDPQGGPHLGGCGNCRGVITIDRRTGALTRNEEYYALAHASRFVPPGARRVASSGAEERVKHVAFVTPAGERVIVVVNVSAATVPFAIREGARVIRHALPAGAVATLRWR